MYVNLSSNGTEKCDPIPFSPKMSEKRNIRDHKRRLLATKYEDESFLKPFIKIPIFVVRCGTNIVISCPSCQERVPLHDISRSFDGHKEIVLVATTKPIEQGLALQLVHKQDANGAGIEVGDLSTAPVSISCQECNSRGIDNYSKLRRRTVVHWSAGVRRLFPSLKSECGTEPSE
ncbi:hypothetical protein Patl1_37456 [Pistacia atlantica]|nr:hypothetical protein Patl1_37456 [Pistacia atlantica]